MIDWTQRADESRRAVCQINIERKTQRLGIGRTATCGRSRRAGCAAPCAEPPAGTSPAAPVWDDFWRVLEESDTPVFLHIGAGGLASGEADDPMFPSRQWADAPTLHTMFPDRPGGEERIGPYFIVVAHLAAEVFITCLVMGGVFERFPRLRFGAIEFGASWLGPLCERLDRHAALLQKVGVQYPLLPSEYIRRNVRVTPQWAEPVDVLVERYGIAESLVFSTDYPHIEGGRTPIDAFAAMTSRVSPSYTREVLRRERRAAVPVGAFAEPVEQVSVEVAISHSTATCCQSVGCQPSVLGGPRRWIRWSRIVSLSRADHFRAERLPELAR